MSTTTTGPTSNSSVVSADRRVRAAVGRPDARRIAGERPTTGVPFLRLIGLELRKMFNTRAGRWLLIAIGAIIATTLVIMFFNESGHHRFEDYLTATTTP